MKRLRKLAADDNDLFLQQQTRAAEAYTRKIKDVLLSCIVHLPISELIKNSAAHPNASPHVRFTKLDMSGVAPSALPTCS